MKTNGARGAWGALVLALGLAGWCGGQEPEPRPRPERVQAIPLPTAREDGRDVLDSLEAFGGESDEGMMTVPESPESILPAESAPIDLNTALRLAGAQNPELMIARQRVVEAAALRQMTAAMILPSINFGVNYDAHTGNLQQSNGNVISVNRSAVYVGAGSGATAAGTVPIPGVVLVGNPAVGVYAFLATRQHVAQREFESEAARNQAFLQAALGFTELLRAEGRRAVAIQIRDEAKHVAKLTAAYANAGQGRHADAHRALTELQLREGDIKSAEGEILTASAQLCFTLNLDPSIRLKPTDAVVVPHPIVPDPIPIRELIAIAITQRPELKERQAVIQQALLALGGAKALPFSPNFLIGYSAGGFGGGSNLVRPVFGGFGGRTDFDVVAFWTLQNLGVGNAALVNMAKARLGAVQYREIAMLDQVRAEVAEAYAKTHARYSQIGVAEQGVRGGLRGFRQDLLRIENTVAPAIDTIDSLRLLARVRYAYLDSIADYDRAQFELYVALGQPPADTLARPVPTTGLPASGEPATAEMNPNLDPTAVPSDAEFGEAVP